MKKFISICLSVLIMLSVMPQGTFNLTAGAEAEDYYTYYVSNGEVTITDFDTSISGNISIPSTLGGYPVTSIGDSAFYDCYNLTSITIPDSVTSIGTQAFYNCTSLASITIPNSVTSIGDSAFRYCVNLTDVYYSGRKADKRWIYIGSDNSRLLMATWHCKDGEIVANVGITTGYTGDCTWTLEGTVLTISGDGCTEDYCTWYREQVMENEWVSYVDEILPTPWGTLISDVIIDGNVTVGMYAFNNCDINTLTLKNDNIYFNSDNYFSIRDEIIIATGAKFICLPNNNAKKITIPDSVTNISAYTFNACDSITSIIVDENNKHYSSVDGVLFNKNKTELIKYPCGKTDTNYYLPNSITSIGYSAFSDCSSLTSITIPDSVTSIGDDAFIDCTNLTDVYYSGTEEGRNYIHISSGNAAIANAKWNYNTCINKSEHIYDDALDNICNVCNAVRTNHVYDDDCSSICNLCGFVRIAPHVFDDNSDEFCNDCNAQRGTTGSCVWILDGTRLTITGEGQMASYYRTYYLPSDGVIDILTPPWGTEITDLIIGSSVKIGEFAFEKCIHIKNIFIFNMNAWCNMSFYAKVNFCGMTEIASPLFKYADNLYLNGELVTDLVIPDGVKNVSINSFNSYSNLTSVTIPDSVTNINYGAFVGCNNLKNVFYTGTKEQKSKITIDTSNTNLINATWHYNSCIGSAEHTYNNTCDTNCNVCGFTREVEHTYDDAADTECNVCGYKKYTPGDIDNSGEVTLTDVVTLAQYVAEWDVNCNEAALDVNGDGEVSLLDVVHLAQYVAEWEGIELN